MNPRAIAPHGDAVLLACLFLLSLLPPAAAQEPDAEMPLIEEVLTTEESLAEEAPAPDEPAAPAGTGPMSHGDIAARVGPSVVQVAAPGGNASGVRIEQGVLTNAHVVRGETSVEVIRNDGQRAPATVTRCDDKVALALLRTDLPLPAVPMQLAREHRQGDPVLVLDYPASRLIGAGQATLTSGLVSAIREEDDGRLVVQTDAAMTGGNSGGAILNMQGNLIAVASYGIRGAQGFNFGVATESVQSFLAAQPRMCTSSAATPNPTARATPAVGEVISSDNFDDEARGILPRAATDPARWRRGYVSGEYQVQKIDPSWTAATAAYVPGTHANASISVDARLVGDFVDRYVLLTCRESRAGAYGLLVSPEEGTFTLARAETGSQVTLIAQASGAIRRGNATNHLELSCVGDNISVSINGSQVASVRDSALKEGAFGFGLSARNLTADALFDNLVLTRR
jgi:S1-C subfamily serine protease